MKLHVFAEKFRAYSKAAASGGGTVVTSTVVTPSHTHQVTIPNHTHDVVIGTKTSTEKGEHVHMWAWYIDDTPPTLTKREYETYDYNGVLGRKVNLETGGAYDLYCSKLPAHSHDVAIGTVTSASGGGTTVTSASGGGSHSHDVTIPDHTHGIDYGIYEEAITGRTLSAILYDPDGNLLEDFGVVCTGEDSQIIDLSDYFSTLKYGMYRLELTASGRLRARLIFYELCKMYAI